MNLEHRSSGLRNGLNFWLLFDLRQVTGIYSGSKIWFLHPFPFIYLLTCEEKLHERLNNVI